jgi:hypothetical protein
MVSLCRRFRRCCVILKLSEPLIFAEYADAAEKKAAETLANTDDAADEK